MTQPGYDAMAQQYAELIDGPFQSPLEQAAVDAFAAQVRVTGLGSSIVDVGCGIGHVVAYLSDAGFATIGVDPSVEMLALARAAHPAMTFDVDDAALRSVELSGVAGLLARFSLIHVKPEQVRTALRDWASRLRSGSVVLIAGQSTDEPGVVEFDHVVARAWRWHPDTIAEALTDAGFDEVWRTVSRPAEGFHRFPEFHLCAVRR